MWEQAWIQLIHRPHWTETCLLVFRFVPHLQIIRKRIWMLSLKMIKFSKLYIHSFIPVVLTELHHQCVDILPLPCHDTNRSFVQCHIRCFWLAHQCLVLVYTPQMGSLVWVQMLSQEGAQLPVERQETAHDHSSTEFSLKLPNLKIPDSAPVSLNLHAVSSYLHVGSLFAPLFV